MGTIADNLTQVHARIDSAAQTAHRNAQDITLVAVSKTRTAEDIALAAGTGQQDFGENYLQEALDKIATLADRQLTWHFIGPIQSNKTRAIASHFDWVHSVDRYKIARRLSEQRPPDLPPLHICLQVNISNEASKSGLTADAVAELATRVSTLPNLRLRGLMAIPALADTLAQQRKPFAALLKLRNSLQADGLQLDCLSMGMSTDLEAAIAEGSTHVRVGTAIFGARV